MSEKDRSNTPRRKVLTQGERRFAHDLAGQYFNAAGRYNGSDAFEQCFQAISDAMEQCLAPSETTPTEIERLRAIEHAAWHLLDDSEYRMNVGERVVQQSQFDELAALLPEGHP